jgi:uncharacterized protein
VLAGVSLTGDRFFYVNPLTADGTRKFNHGSAERFAWTGCPCCPVNVVRLVPRCGDFVYAVRGDALYVNLFAANTASIELAGGRLQLRQETRYPWDGLVRLHIEAAPAVPVTMHLRIPGWAKGRPLPTDLYRYADAAAEPVALTVNGEGSSLQEQRGYATIARSWRAGDVVELKLPMPARRVLAHAKVTADAGLVAVERGPLVYCAEGADHDGRALDLVLPDDARLTPVSQPNVLGGITVLRGPGQRITTGADGVRRSEPAELTLVPYYAWNHRGAGPMTVWLPATARAVRLPYDTSKWVGANYTPAYASFEK